MALAQTEPSRSGEVAASVPNGSHADVIRSTAVIAGSTIIAALLSIVRYKALALLIGPTGIGLLGIYTTILDLAQTLAGLGVQQSGVRQVAEANGKDDARQIALVVRIVRWSSLLLACIGAALLACLALPVSRFTFGDDAHILAVVFLSLAVLLRVAAAGEVALVQGMRRIGDLARINIASAVAMTVVAIPTVYLFGNAGIAPSLSAMALAALVASWWYSRRIATVPVSTEPGESLIEVRRLLGLGVIFMASGVLTLGAAYAIRLILVRLHGLEAAGLYQAAWTVGGLYATFVLQAMGTDFYPRLTAVAHDNEACNRLVNEQIQVSVLIAGPGLLATLTAADLAISLLYSGAFQPAADLLRWMCLGMALRMVAWPLGFVVIAKGARGPMLWTEIAASCVHVGLAWYLAQAIGLTGAGIAFVGLYLWHGAVINVIVYRMTEFRWSRANLGLVAMLFPAAAIIFVSFTMLSSWQALTIGTLITAATCLLSLQRLVRLLPPETLPAVLRKRLRRA